MQHTERIPAIITRAIIQKDEATGNRGVPVREPAREESGALGRRTDGGKNDGVPVAQAAACRAIRICRMDRGSDLRFILHLLID